MGWSLLRDSLTWKHERGGFRKQRPKKRCGFSLGYHCIPNRQHRRERKKKQQKQKQNKSTNLLTKYNNADLGGVRSVLVGNGDVVFTSVLAHTTLAVYSRQLWLIHNLDGVGWLKVPLVSFLLRLQMAVRGVLWSNTRG